MSLNEQCVEASQLKHMIVHSGLGSLSEVSVLVLKMKQLQFWQFLAQKTDLKLEKLTIDWVPCQWKWKTILAAAVTFAFQSSFHFQSKAIHSELNFAVWWLFVFLCVQLNTWDDGFLQQRFSLSNCVMTPNFYLPVWKRTPSSSKRCLSEGHPVIWGWVTDPRTDPKNHPFWGQKTHLFCVFNWTHEWSPPVSFFSSWHIVTLQCNISLAPRR